ncbi:Ig-like domain-containing protein, partial [Jannaschia sp.]|nr:Ig-like domain-containing protein [Jannaschia sp.]
STFYSFGEIVSFFEETGGPEAVDDTARLAEDATALIEVLTNDTAPEGENKAVTEIDGTAVAVGDSTILSSGAMVSLGLDGVLSYDTNGAFDALETGETAEDSFAYTTSTLSGSDTATVSVTIDGQSDPAALIGQSGTVEARQTSKSEWHSVTFDTEIQDAVVVMGPLSYNGKDASVARVRNVTDLGFEWQIDEWDYLDGAHTFESVGWLALSAGSHALASGQTVVAGTQTVSTTFEDVSFGETLEDAVVLSQVATENGKDAVTTRTHSIDADGFSLRVQEEEAKGAHTNETVSWIAIETG